jgi:hypothetical protein
MPAERKQDYYRRIVLNIKMYLYCICDFPDQPGNHPRQGIIKPIYILFSERCNGPINISFSS